MNDIGVARAMTYKEAMSQKCKCGRFSIGGWQGFKRDGKPFFTRVSVAVYLVPGIILTEEHTISVCYYPTPIEDNRKH